MRSPVSLLPEALREPLARAAAPIGAAGRLLTWVPIRSLTSRHRSRILSHLLALDEHDRYLRFGSRTTDAQIARYTDALDFERDEMFGIFNRRLELVAMAHLAYETSLTLAAHGTMAEFGVSVAPKARGRGYGARLFDHAVLHARNRGFGTLFIHALSENAAMLRIARRIGATVERSGGESAAWLALPPDTLASQVGAAVDQQVAEWDYRMKLHAQRSQRMRGEGGVEPRAPDRETEDRGA